LTPPRVTPSQPDFAEARRLVANAIEKASTDAEKQDSALSAPTGVAAGVSAGIDVDASAGRELAASASPDKGGDEDERAICYVP
ncbi:LytR family transcriptional regulator, partial [Geobacillus sp. MMMUD3]|nr:LytR family transcriptional regulator [Geobacillus sp. MMMUD3]